MPKAASPCPGASPHVCSLTALCRDSASSLLWGLGASSHREQLLLQNKCPIAWEPKGEKKLGGAEPHQGWPLSSPSLIPSGCSCLGGQHPFCLVIPGWCPPFMDSAAGRATLPAQLQIPGGSWLWQRREATEPQLQWKQGEVQSIPLQGLGTGRLTLSWTPPLLPYDSFLTPFTPWPAGQPSLLRLFAAGGRMRLGLELMLTWHRTCKGSQPGRALPHPQAI